MTTALSCGTVLAGSGRVPQRNVLLFERAGLFVAEASSGQTATIDLGGLFVMPGFVDAHAHLSAYFPSECGAQQDCPFEQRARDAEARLRGDLEAGTTTMRILGEPDGIDVYLRDAIARGDMVGPHLLVAGVAITPDAVGRAPTPMDHVEAVRRMARENLERGADCVKIHATAGAEGDDQPLFEPDALGAAADEARRAGTYLAAHAHGGSGVAAAVRAGARTIEHGFYLSPEDVALLVEHDCWLVGTYAFDFHPDGLDRWMREAGEAPEVERTQALRERIELHTRAALTSGVRVALGTNHLRGGYMAEEILLAIRFGMTVNDALVAATRGGAEALRVVDQVGTITPGKRADLVAFRRDPLVDPTVLREPAFVMQRGVVVRHDNARQPALPPTPGGPP